MNDFIELVWLRNAIALHDIPNCPPPLQCIRYKVDPHSKLSKSQCHVIFECVHCLVPSIVQYTLYQAHTQSLYRSTVYSYESSCCRPGVRASSEAAQDQQHMIITSRVVCVTNNNNIYSRGRPNVPVPKCVRLTRSPRVCMSLDRSVRLTCFTLSKEVLQEILSFCHCLTHILIGTYFMFQLTLKMYQPNSHVIRRRRTIPVCERYTLRDFIKWWKISL